MPGLVPNLNNDLILGAVGILQFDLAAYRLYEQRWPEIRYLATWEL